VSLPAGAGGRLAAILRAGRFAVTGEIVPPLAASGQTVTAHARGLVGSIDAANVTDNPTASAHMSPVAGVAFVDAAGLEPTVQLAARDRNRLAITADLLGAWALGARNLLCLSGDPLSVGDHPDAVQVGDLTVNDVVGLARRMRDEGTTLSGKEIADPPRYLIGVADVPLAERYDAAKLEGKLDAGADLVWTQIAFDVEALASWADAMRARGLFERAKVLVGVMPLRSAKSARFMDEKLPGVTVPPSMIAALDDAGEDARTVGHDLTIAVVRGIREIEGVAGVHLMGMGDDAVVRRVVEDAGLLPRPTGA
jgi:methylenetetrahydrofolate reductase (NADPH)